MLTSTHVRLTPNEQSHKGAIWNTHVRINYLHTSVFNLMNEFRKSVFIRMIESIDLPT